MEKIFEPDEMAMVRVENPKTWTPETLFDTEGIFYVGDVVSIIGIKYGPLIKHVKSLQERNVDPWRAMGMKKIWTQWIVRMKVFAIYYRKHPLRFVRSVGEDWDEKTLLSQEGRFYLVDVCERLPMTSDLIRYRASKSLNPKEECGIWKDRALNRTVVNMKPFAAWIKEIMLD